MICLGLDSTGCESKIKCASQAGRIQPREGILGQMSIFLLLSQVFLGWLELLGRGCLYIYDVGRYRGKVRKLFLKWQEILSI